MVNIEDEVAKTPSSSSKMAKFEDEGMKKAGLRAGTGLFIVIPNLRGRGRNL